MKYADAAVDAVGLIAGDGVTTYLKINYHHDKILPPLALAASKSATHIAEKDCFACVQK